MKTVWQYKKILVVDDDPDMLEILVFFMRKKGFAEVLSATNGKEAFQIVSDQHVDIVITDVRMPVETGLQLLENIRKKSNIPVVLMITGFHDLPHDEAYHKGAYEILNKPFTRAELDTALERLLASSLTLS